MKATMQHIKRNVMSKKIKIKIINNFIASKKTLNVKTSEKDENYV